MEVYRCEYSPTRTVYLIDTPGFDDTSLSEADVLRALTAWMTATYSNQIRLNGIFYLHRITDVRVPGSARRNLRMFQKLCGSDELKNVILVSTMWDQVQENFGIQRETELKDTKNLWGHMVECGSRVERHWNDQSSARRLLGMFMNLDSQGEQTEMSLAIQKEMVDDQKKLQETKAASEVSESIEERIQQHVKRAEKLQQDLLQAQNSRDDGWRTELDMLSNEMRCYDEDRRVALEKLATDMKQLIEDAFEHDKRESPTAKFERVSGAYNNRMPEHPFPGLPVSPSDDSLSKGYHSRDSKGEDPTRPDLPTRLSEDSPSPPLSRRSSQSSLIRFRKMSHSRRPVGSNWPKRTRRDLSLSLRGHHCSFVGPAQSKSYVWPGRLVSGRVNDYIALRKNTELFPAIYLSPPSTSSLDWKALWTSG